MAFVPNFENDIFISYTHADNVPVAGVRWVDQFHQSLENWLCKRRGISGLTIWRDPALDGNTVFDETIENRIKSSALFIALYSRNYPKSEYCRKELAAFYQYNRDRPAGLVVGERSRIFNVLLNNIPHPEWPPEFQGTSGFPIHDAASEADFGDFTSPSDERFEQQLRKIVDAADATLRDLAKLAAVPTPEPVEQKRIAVFLADVSDSLQAQRDRLIAEISPKARVLSQVPPPWEYAPHRQRVTELCRQADLAVHLVDAWPGRRIGDSAGTTYPREQAQIALGLPVPTLVWVPDTLRIEAIEDDAHRAWLQQLEGGARGGASYEFVRAAPRALLDLVAQKLQALEQKSAQPQQALSFLIDTHQKDQRYAYKLADFLADKGADVDFNKESQDPTQSLTNFEQAVRRANNLVILFGQVTSAWLQGRIKTAVKVLAEQLASEPTFTLETVWVYLLPGSQGSAAIPRLPPLIRISVLDNSRAETIDPGIVAQMLAPPGGGGRP